MHYTATYNLLSVAPRESPREPSLELARRRRAVPSSPRIDHSRFRFISASPLDNILSWLWLGAPGTYEAQNLHAGVLDKLDSMLILSTPQTFKDLESLW